MKDVNGVGILVGIVCWLALVITSTRMMRCIGYQSCSESDFVTFAIISIGFVAPSCFAALIGSALGDWKHND
jgi:hypothetical protein